MTVIGSIIGCLLLYSVGRKGGEAMLKKRFAADKIAEGAGLVSKIRDAGGDRAVAVAAAAAVQDFCPFGRRLSGSRGFAS